MRNILRFVIVLLLLAFTGSNVRAAGLLTIDQVIHNSQETDAHAVSGTINWIPGTHKLLYSVRKGSISKIFAYDKDTHSLKTLGLGENPVAAPDGRHFTFLGSIPTNDAVHSTEHGVVAQIWMGDYSGGTPILLRTTTGNDPAILQAMGGVQWSPDSRRLVYCTMHDEPTDTWHVGGNKDVIVYPQALAKHVAMNHYIDIHVFDIASKSDRVIMRHPGEVGVVTWLNDRALLYEHDSSQGFSDDWSSLSELSLDGRTRTLVSRYHRQIFYHPAVSPKGDKIAFSVNPDPIITYPEQDELGFVDLHTGKVQILTHCNSNVRSFAWASDDAILYTDGSSTRRQIFKQVPGSPRIQLTNAPGFRKGTAVSSDGRAVGWLAVDPNGTVALETGDLQPDKITRIQRVAELVNPTRGVVSGLSLRHYWTSTDGLQLDGYVTLPVGYIQGKRYPLAVVLHGGPTGLMEGTEDDAWPGQMDFIEYFAQHGFAVFVPDYRSSGNFGFNAITQDRLHHRAMQSDFADIMSGVASLERAGIADPQREVVLGHSYGGLEVNWLITQTSHFRAAISYEAGTDWYYEWGTTYGPNDYSNWKLMGTPFTEPDVYRRNSSITYAGNIHTPTLFINAEDGINAPSSAWLYSAGLNNHVDTQFVFYRGEEHVIQRPDNERDLLVRLIGWIDKHLGRS